MKKSQIFAVIKSILVAYVISFLLLTILAALLFWCSVPEAVVRSCVCGIYVISCFVAGIVLSWKRSRKKFLWGIFAGGLYATVLFILSLVFGDAEFGGVAGVFPTIILCILGGMFGGMLQTGRNRETVL